MNTDKLDALAHVLFGRRAVVADWLGGPDARILDEAAKKIAALEQQLAEANARLEGKWISVEERLPDEKVTVLVAHWMTGEGVLTKPLNGWAVWFAQRRNDRWERSDGLSDDVEFHGAVKFWQPLPAPPTDKGEQ